MKINVIIPVFNEKKTIVKLYKKVQKIKGYNKKIIIVDDGSTDGSRDIIKKRILSRNVTFYFHKKNLGKGAAIKTALKSLNGDIVIIQDADLEYNPNDYHKLLRPFKNKEIKVVYGSRVLNKSRYSFKFSLASNFRVFANYVLTTFSNFVNRQNLTDAHTCYKVFDAELFKKLELKENNFNFCPEVTTKISNQGVKIHELPIKYQGRDYDEGKKIKLIDALKAIYCILRYKFFR